MISTLGLEGNRPDPTTVKTYRGDPRSLQPNNSGTPPPPHLCPRVGCLGGSSDSHATGLVRGGEEKEGQTSQAGIRSRRCGQVRSPSISTWAFGEIPRGKQRCGLSLPRALTPGDTSPQTRMTSCLHPILALPLTGCGTWDMNNFLRLSVFIQKVGGGLPWWSNDS